MAQSVQSFPALRLCALAFLFIACRGEQHFYSTKWRLVNVGPPPASGLWHVHAVEWYSTFWFDTLTNRAYCHSKLPESGDRSQMQAFASGSSDEQVNGASEAFKNHIEQGSGWTSQYYRGSAGAWIGVEFPERVEVACVQVFQGDAAGGVAEYLELQALRTGTGVGNIAEQWDSVSQWGGVSTGIMQPWTWTTLPEGHRTTPEFTQLAPSASNSTGAMCSWPWLDHATGLQFEDPDAQDTVCSAAATVKEGEACSVKLDTCGTSGKLVCQDGSIQAHVDVVEGDADMRECVLQQIQFLPLAGTPVAGYLQTVEPPSNAAGSEAADLTPLLIILGAVSGIVTLGLCYVMVLYIRLRAQRKRDQLPLTYIPGIGNSVPAQHSTTTMPPAPPAPPQQRLEVSTDSLPEPVFDTEVSGTNRSRPIQPAKIGSPADSKSNNSTNSGPLTSELSEDCEAPPVATPSRGKSATAATPSTPSRSAPNRSLVYKNIEEALEASRRKKALEKDTEPQDADGAAAPSLSSSSPSLEDGHGAEPLHR
mmetsp:Transcript_10435/g.23608  ORF Transcript_10435/g.23608 Transcript_10435/m.23608 type:complete len:535 (-) Transcript_10435:15-1619(-)